MKRALTAQHKKQIIDRLYGAWLKNPELRLSQMIWNKVSTIDFFFIEDEDFIKILEQND